MSRTEYATVGILLSLGKYLIELTTIASMSGLFYTPLDFVSPFLESREKFLNSMPLWAGWAWLLWTMPFLWIGVGMSLRRALDAGISPWFGLSILVPFANLPSMLVLAVLPSANKSKISETQKPTAVRDAEVSRIVADLYRPSMVEPMQNESSVWSSSFMAATLGIVAGAAYLLLSVVLSVYVLHSYGTAMFFGAPIVTCAVSSFYLNRHGDRGFGITFGHSLLTLLAASLGFLLFGIEGGICIIMAMPIFVPVGIIGTVVGYAIAVSCHRPNHDERKGLYGCIAILPLIAWIETVIDKSPIIEARSQVIIQAPIEVVWERVINFPEITRPPEGILNIGVAYPIRASIDGYGTGAIRNCVFNTGTFVEPITQWGCAESPKLRCNEPARAHVGALAIQTHSPTPSRRFISKH